MGHALGLSIVAEGIENQEQVDRLGELDCDYGQGFFIGKPMTAKQVSDALAGLPYASTSGRTAITWLWERALKDPPPEPKLRRVTAEDIEELRKPAKPRPVAPLPPLQAKPRPVVSRSPSSPLWLETPVPSAGTTPGDHRCARVECRAGSVARAKPAKVPEKCLPRSMRTATRLRRPTRAAGSEAALPNIGMAAD